MIFACFILFYLQFFTISTVKDSSIKSSIFHYQSDVTPKNPLNLTAADYPPDRDHPIQSSHSALSDIPAALLLP